jgi:hypothetical protein
VRTLQRERCPGIVIKARRLPAIDAVTTGTIRYVSAASKLPPVRIVVAFRTLRRGSAKVHVLRGRFQTWRAMAIDARHSAMSPKQREARLRMIETVEFFPLNRVMACLASHYGAVHAFRCHSFAELA